MKTNYRFYINENIKLILQPHDNLLAIFGIILGIFLLVFPLISFLSSDPFYWNATRPQFIHGLIELLILIVFCWWALSSPKKNIAYLVFGIIVLVYSRRHAIDLAIAINLLYLEGFLAFGTVINRLLLHQELDSTIFRRSTSLVLLFITGLMTWSAIMWIAGLIGFGTLPIVQTLTVIILGISLLLTNRHDRFIYHIYRFSLKLTGWSSLFTAILITITLGLFARTNVVMHYDSLWYGLRLDRVFFGEGTPFDSLGLSAVVYYYPKLYEMILSPMSTFGDFSILLGVSILFWVILLIAIYSLLSQINLNLQEKIIATSVIGTIPVILNMAIATKGEIIETLFLIMAMGQLISFYETQQNLQYSSNLKSAGTNVLLFLGFLLLAFSTRPSNLIYVIYLIILFIIVAITGRLRNFFIKNQTGNFSSTDTDNVIFSWYFFFIILISTTLIQYRTFSQIGVFYVAPEQVLKFQSYFGLIPNFPFGKLPEWPSTEQLIGLSIPSVLNVLAKIILYPANLGNIRIAWVSNVWVWLLVMAIANRTFQKDSKLLALDSGIIAGLSIMGSIFLVFLIMLYAKSKGGDGNYYIGATVSLIILGFYIGRHIISKTPFIVVLLLFVLCNFTISFFSAGWATGTKSFDLNFRRSPFDQSSQTMERLSQVNLSEIANFLADEPNAVRVIGFTPQPVSFLLPKRYEPIQNLAWSIPWIFNSADSFIDYLRLAKIQFIVLPKNIDTAFYSSKLNNRNTEFKKTWSNSDFKKLWDTIEKSNNYYLLNKQFDTTEYEIWRFNDLSIKKTRD